MNRCRASNEYRVGSTIKEMPASTEAFAVVMYRNNKSKWEETYKWNQEGDNRNYQLDVRQNIPKDGNK